MSTRSALILVDLQKDFLEADGRMPIDRGQLPGLLESTNRAIQQAREEGTPVIAITNTFHRWDPGNLFRRGAAIAGSPGAAPDPRIAQDTIAATFTKARSSAFSNPALDAWLRARHIDTLLVAGVFANGCVAATVRGAIDRGYSVQLLSTGIADSSDRARKRGLERCARFGAHQSA